MTPSLAAVFVWSRSDGGRCGLVRRLFCHSRRIGGVRVAAFAARISEFGVKSTPVRWRRAADWMPPSSRPRASKWFGRTAREQPPEQLPQPRLPTCEPPSSQSRKATAEIRGDAHPRPKVSTGMVASERSSLATGASTASGSRTMTIAASISLASYSQCVCACGSSGPGLRVPEARPRAHFGGKFKCLFNRVRAMIGRIKAYPEMSEHGCLVILDKLAILEKARLKSSPSRRGGTSV
jgi:hypothetical protein